MTLGSRLSGVYIISYFVIEVRLTSLIGMIRRGMTTEALRQFMLLQGPSQNQVLLEWDSIWTLNKKVIDPIAPRFCAIGTEGMSVVV